MWHYDYVGEKTIIFRKCYLKKKAMLDGTLCGIMNILKEKKKILKLLVFFQIHLKGNAFVLKEGWCEA